MRRPQVPIWVIRSTGVVVLFGAVLAVLWKVALERPAQLKAEIEGHTLQVANLDAFLRANDRALRLADRIRVEEITRWIPSSLSPHEAKARILASALQHGVVVDNLTIEEVRALRGDSVSTLQDVPVIDDASATLLPEEIEAMKGAVLTTGPVPSTVEAEPILGQPFSVTGEAAFLPLLDWLAQLKEGSPLTAITGLTLERIPLSEQSHQSWHHPSQAHTMQFQLQIVYGYRDSTAGRDGEGRR